MDKLNCIPLHHQNIVVAIANCTRSSIVNYPLCHSLISLNRPLYKLKIINWLLFFNEFSSGYLFLFESLKAAGIVSGAVMNKVTVIR